MSPRRYGPLALAFAALVACKDVDQQDQPDQLVIATFQPAPNAAFPSPVIPLPNDLALQGAPALSGVQRELLMSFIAAGGFPSDQEVPITIQLRTRTLDPSTGSYVDAASNPPPAGLDLATVDPSTVALLRVDAPGGPAAVPFEVGGYDPTTGVLTLRRAPGATGSRRWETGASTPGRYVVALRGGDRGIRTSAGQPIGPDSAIALIAPNRDLRVKENQPPGGLSPAQVAALEGTGQTPGLRQLYGEPHAWGKHPAADQWVPLPAPAGLPSPFEAVSTVFPHDEIASIQTFTVAPASSVRPLTDSGSGQLPFPSDFLLTSGAGCADVRPEGDARPCVRYLPASFGAAAGGLHTLDGFSTTGALVVPFTGPVKAETLTRSTVLLFRLGATPQWLHDVRSSPAAARYVTAPSGFVPVSDTVRAPTSAALQPAIEIDTDPTNPASLKLHLPPLDEGSRYAVVVTRGVRDLADQPVRRSTLGDLLFTFAGPLYDPDTQRSQVPGVSDADAAGLQALRAGLAPLLDNIGALTGGAVASKDEVVMAYTVTTQTMADVPAQLSAAPYHPAVAPLLTPGEVAPFDTEAVLGFPAAAFPEVGEFLETTVPTIEVLDPATGAFYPDLAQFPWPPSAQTLLSRRKDIKVLVALPKAAAVATTCAGQPVACAPVVVFHHGIKGSRYQLAAVANELARRGLIGVATDAPLHGDRAYCARNADCVVAGGGEGVCTPDPARAGQGDAVPPGTCTTGTLRYDPAYLATQASGNYFISGNFFRVRDSVRQDVLDQSALIRSVAPPPGGAATTLQAALGARGLAVDPRYVYFYGHSLGGIYGTLVTASNPRISRALFNSSGGSWVDIFTTSPQYQLQLVPLFTGLLADVLGGRPFSLDMADPTAPAYDPVVAARYGQLLLVARWILDPADPLNFARFVESKHADPTLLGALGPLGYATTEAWGNYANCDPAVPNPTSRELYALAGIDTTLYTSASDANGCVPHAFLLTTEQAQAEAAQYLLDRTTPGATSTLP